MDQYPRWLLALAALTVIPAVLMSVFFIFGHVSPFGHAEWVGADFAIYLLSQLLWLAPVGLTFGAIWLWGKCQERWATAVLVLGLMLTAADVWLLLAS